MDPAVETLVEAARTEALAAGISPTESFISQERILAEKERERQARRAAKFGFAHEDEDDEDEDEDEEGSVEGSGDDDEADGDRVNEPLGVGDVWVDSLRWCREQLARFAEEFGEDLYTAEERAMGVENVRTGLKRSLEEESDEEEEEEEEEESDEEGDTTMRDTAPIAPSSGQPAGQHGLSGGGAVAASLPGMDAEWMLAMAARGDDEVPMAMLETQRGQFQHR